MNFNRLLNAIDPELGAVQRQSCDYFDFWRQGRENLHMPDYRRDEIAERQHPRKGQWRGFDDKDIPKRRQLKYEGYPIVGYSGKGPDQLVDAAEDASEMLTEKMEAAGFRFVRILGWGGLGVAAMFEAVDKDEKTGKRKKIVCKMDLHSGYSYIGPEVEMHKVCLFVVW